MKERHKRICEILEAQGSVTVEQLTKQLFASEATVRRALKEMEQQGLLVRIWGGAVSVNKNDYDPPPFIRSITNLRAKRQIARKACGFVRDNISIFIPSGSTVAELTKLFIEFKNLTVITTGLDNINVLKNYPFIKLIVPGGELHEGYDFVGTVTNETIDRFSADLLLFSCSGITADGFTSKDALRLDIIKKMQKNSTKVVLLSDSSKVGKKYTYKGFGFENIDYVIMEKMPSSQALINRLEKKLIVADRNL